MACCLLCFDDAPHPDDPRHAFMNRWQVGMMEAPGKDPGCCLAGFCCPICTHYVLRKKALHGDMTKYSCCQGYFGCGGKCGEQSCPECCLCMEVSCCNCLAVNATRFLVMDERNIMSDPCDNRLIRFNNCLQLLSCICSLLAICFDFLRDAAQILNCIANVVYWTLVGCISAQLNVELKHDSMAAAYQVPPVAIDYKPEGQAGPQAEVMSRV